jgi:hypothetical protein
VTDTSSGDEPLPGTTESSRSGSSAPAPTSYSGSDAARLSLRLVDAPADEVTSIVVSVESVEASVGGAWTTLVAPAATVDLLTLQGGKYLEMGVAALPPGRVDQLRMRLAPTGDHHVVTPDGEAHALVVPAGEQSGIKLVGAFDVPPCSTGHLTIDFDGKKSLQLVTKGAAAADAWMLRPVVRLKAVVASGECGDAGADGGAAQDAARNGMSSDPCADVACSEGELCENGACRAAE